MRLYVSRSHFSSINYKQQRKMTLLLIGQGSLPVLASVLLVTIYSLSIPTLIDNKMPSKSVWELCYCMIVLYPLFGAILTIVLTKPYYDALKSILQQITFMRPQHETSVLTIKL